MQGIVQISSSQALTLGLGLACKAFLNSFSLYLVPSLSIWPTSHTLIVISFLKS